MKIKLIFIIFTLAMNLSCVHFGSEKTIDLAKHWKFSPDKENIGVSKKWFSIDFDDSNWKTIDAGIKWEEQGYPDLDGYGWYRKTVNVPKDWDGKDVWIKFAAVNDAYDLFVNGSQVSSYGASQYSFAGKPSFTEVSEKLKYGEPNQITVRVNDWGLSGGLWRLPVIITTDKKKLSFSNLYQRHHLTLKKKVMSCIGEMSLMKPVWISQNGEIVAQASAAEDFGHRMLLF